MQFARPKAPSAQAAQQALNGVGYAATATFNAPNVNPNTWNGSPMGTGTYSAQSTPPQSGGPQSIAVDDQGVSYVVIGALSAGPSRFFGIVTSTPFTVGTRAVDNQSTFAGIFDGNTGEPVALASSGTVTVTAAGANVVGSFNGSLEDYAVEPECVADADCASGLVCIGGRCGVVSPPQCTTNAQCAAGQVCQGGTCVTNPNPGCTSDSQCSSPATCQNGQCVVVGMCQVDSQCPSGQRCFSGTCVSAPPPCMSDAQCGPGAVCQGGTCVAGPPMCTTNAQCPAGQQCQGGRCWVPSCDAQGTGSYSGSVTAPMTCSAVGTVATLTGGLAVIGQDEDGQLALFVVDASTGTEGVVIPLTACPGAAATVQVTGAKLYTAASGGAGLTLYAIRTAAGSVTFTSVSAGHYVGTFALTLTGGGTVNGSFNVQ
ncbi:MAG: hypothetical protein JNK82_14725 [Myxococcaceae bacterium]|nr:hypothetical protein [Myxococcaceae bacterium]